MRKKIFFLILFFIIFEAIIFGLYFYFKTTYPAPVAKKLYLKSLPEKTEEVDLVSGVVPHHLAAKSLIANFFKNIAEQSSPETIVLLGPDHFHSGNLNQKQDLIMLSADTEKFLDIETDKSLLAELSQQKNIVQNTSLISLDHGITDLLPFIKSSLPQTKILPIIIPFDFSLADFKPMIEKISQGNEKIMVIASTDFSHYLPVQAADFHDIKSMRSLINFEENNLPSLEVDCPLCLYGSRYYAKLKKQESYKIIGHKNSADFLKADNTDQTTSYFSILFGKNLKNNEKGMGQTILFAGDIMLDRGVADLMKQNSVYYPFEKIMQFLVGTDLAVGNLEGPIVKNPENFGDHAMTFNFSPDILPALKMAKFNLFNLANNHILNRGNDGLAETREFLDQSKLNYFGDPLKCSDEFAYQKDNFLFLGFNKTFSSGCPNEDIIKAVKKAREKNSDKFLIVNLHWGTEYKTINSKSQQDLAHQIIESGADLIIGHHPHVVQNIELYKNKLIFYSLGNFIFDQYFSKNVQQGLAVGLELYSNKYICNLFPLTSKLSQPALMPEEEKIKFLSDLAKNSATNLESQIKSGKIEVNR